MKKTHTGTQIVAKLRQADVLIGQGKSPLAMKRLTVRDKTLLFCLPFTKSSSGRINAACSWPIADLMEG
jgi:hypothetical protein